MKIITCTCICLATFLYNVTAQIIDAKQAAKSKVENRANNKTDQGIDKGLDKVEEGIKGLFKKKKKKEKETVTEEQNNSAETVNDLETGDTGDKKNASTSSFSSYSKFDFVSGEKVIYYDDFARVETGDFPADYNTDASGEVVTIEGKQGKWLNLSKNGSFIPESIGVLPENFTLEFNTGIEGSPSNNMYGFGLNFNTDQDKLMQYMFVSGSFLYLHPGAASASINVSTPEAQGISNDFTMPQWDAENSRFARISIWRQKTRLRVYVNESKLMDVPRFFSEAKPYHLSFFRNFFNDCNLFISDIKFAAGAPDTRNKLISTGKFSTTGILFDVNADKIKPASYGTLKEIATVLNENAGMSVKIIGHTDSDGDDKANLLLSQKRAAAVKAMLVSNFGIDAARLHTDGKGETEPVEPNTTDKGKANNRRVEFIKL